MDDKTASDAEKTGIVCHKVTTWRGALLFRRSFDSGDIYNFYALLAAYEWLFPNSFIVETHSTPWTTFNATVYKVATAFDRLRIVRSAYQ